jgi:hypothetical protein
MNIYTDMYWWAFFCVIFFCRFSFALCAQLFLLKSLSSAADVKVVKAVFGGGRGYTWSGGTNFNMHRHTYIPGSETSKGYLLFVGKLL